MKLLVIGFAFVSLASLVSASPATETKALSFESDPIEYIKEYLFEFLDGFLKKDNYQVSEDVKISKNSYRASEASKRSSSDDYEDKIETYLKSHDAQFTVPSLGSVKLEARNLDEGEIDVKLNFGTGVEEGRKSKLKKIFIPILVFVLLKAITLVPLALGILSLKAWNALQLSFFSFVVAVGLAIFQLCKKLAVDSAVPQLAPAEAWPAQPYYARSIDSEAAQDLAYSAYSR